MQSSTYYVTISKPELGKRYRALTSWMQSKEWQKLLNYSSKELNLNLLGNTPCEQDVLWTSISWYTTTLQLENLADGHLIHGRCTYTAKYQNLYKCVAKKMITPVIYHNIAFIVPTYPELTIDLIKYIHHRHKPLLSVQPKLSIHFTSNSICGANMKKIIATQDTLMIDNYQHATALFYGRFNWIHNIPLQYNP